MQRTLKRESKEPEVVEREAIANPAQGVRLNNYLLPLGDGARKSGGVVPIKRNYSQRRLLRGGGEGGRKPPFPSLAWLRLRFPRWGLIFRGLEGGRSSWHGLGGLVNRPCISCSRTPQQWGRLWARCGSLDRVPSTEDRKVRSQGGGGGNSTTPRGS